MYLCVKFGNIYIRIDCEFVLLNGPDVFCRQNCIIFRANHAVDIKLQRIMKYVLFYFAKCTSHKNFRIKAAGFFIR
jgi:hypothetical protein